MESGFKHLINQKDKHTTVVVGGAVSVVVVVATASAKRKDQLSSQEVCPKVPFSVVMIMIHGRPVNGMK